MSPAKRGPRPLTWFFSYASRLLGTCISQNAARQCLAEHFATCQRNDTNYCFFLVFFFSLSRPRPCWSGDYSEVAAATHPQVALDGEEPPDGCQVALSRVISGGARERLGASGDVRPPSALTIHGGGTPPPIITWTLQMKKICMKYEPLSLILSRFGINILRPFWC